MKSLILGLLLTAGLIGPASSQSYHQGYTTKNGTYVAPHWQSAPDRSYNNNWGVSPNVNPYTGQQGAKQPTWNDRPPAPNFNSPNLYPPQRR